MSNRSSEGSDGSRSPSDKVRGDRDKTYRRESFHPLLGDQNRVANAITRFSGSMAFVYLHIAWFALWVLLNTGVFGRALVFDPFPYGLLTMIVSLEAIFLSTFVLISQNLTAQHDEYREDQDFRTNVRSEVWLQHIGEALGVDKKRVDDEQHARLARAEDSENRQST